MDIASSVPSPPFDLVFKMKQKFDEDVEVVDVIDYVVLVVFEESSIGQTTRSGLSI